MRIEVVKDSSRAVLCSGREIGPAKPTDGSDNLSRWTVNTAVNTASPSSMMPPSAWPVVIVAAVVVAPGARARPNTRTPPTLKGGPVVDALRQWISAGRPPSPPPCALGGEWTYDLNNYCSYNWTVALSGTLEFGTTCPTDGWTHATGSKPSPTGSFTLTFTDDNGTVVAQKPAVIHPSCHFVDVADGGLYARGPPLPNLGEVEWLRVASGYLLRRAWITADDGTPLLTPGYPTHYNGQWMRDGFYGLFNGRDLLQNTTIAVGSVRWMLSHQRPGSGVMPVMVSPHGDARYGTQCNNSLPGCQDLDNAPFAVFLAVTAVVLQPSLADGLAFFREHAPQLVAAMDSVPRTANGMVYAAPGLFNVGYGFQDSVVKTGEVLYSSVLYANAAEAMALLAETAGGPLLPLVADFQNRSSAIAAVLGPRLWDPSAGLFRASWGGLESDQLDVWGSAAAAIAGLTTPEQEAAIAATFQANPLAVFFEGQVREIPAPDHWEVLKSGHDARDQTYQNGGFWATPHYHVLPLLARHNASFACRLFADTVASFRSHGVNEWVGPFWPNLNAGAPGYIASAANTWAAADLMDQMCYHAGSSIPVE